MLRLLSAAASPLCRARLSAVGYRSFSVPVSEALGLAVSVASTSRNRVADMSRAVNLKYKVYM